MDIVALAPIFGSAALIGGISVAVAIGRARVRRLRAYHDAQEALRTPSQMQDVEKVYWALHNNLRFNPGDLVRTFNLNERA